MPSHLRTATTKTCARTRSAQAFGEHLPTKLLKTFSGELQHFMGHVSHLLLWSSPLKFLVVDLSTLGPAQPLFVTLVGASADECQILLAAASVNCVHLPCEIASNPPCEFVAVQLHHWQQNGFPKLAIPQQRHCTFRHVPSRCCRGRPRCRHPLWYQCLF